MKRKEENEMRNAFPVIKYDYQGKLVTSNGTALPLLGQWNCRHGAKIPASVLKMYPELAYALVDAHPVECVITMGDCKIWFDIVPFPEAGYVGMYGHSIEMCDTKSANPILRMAG